MLDDDPTYPTYLTYPTSNIRCWIFTRSAPYCRSVTNKGGILNKSTSKYTKIPQFFRRLRRARPSKTSFSGVSAIPGYFLFYRFEISRLETVKLIKIQFPFYFCSKFSQRHNVIDSYNCEVTCIIIPKLE